MWPQSRVRGNRSCSRTCPGSRSSVPLLLFVCADPLERSWGAGVLPARPGRSWGWRCGVHARRARSSPLSVRSRCRCLHRGAGGSVNPPKQALPPPFWRWKLRPLGGLHQGLSKLSAQGQVVNVSDSGGCVVLVAATPPCCQRVKVARRLVHQGFSTTLFTETGGGLWFAESWPSSWWLRATSPPA